MERIGNHGWRTSSYSTNGAECVEVGLDRRAGGALGAGYHKPVRAVDVDVTADDRGDGG